MVSPKQPEQCTAGKSHASHSAAHGMFASPDLAHFPFAASPGWEYSLPVVYLTWALIVCAMYPLWRWYAALETRRSDPWLSYS
jgi:hypothetical protein